MRKNGRLFQSEVTDRLRDRGIPVIPREPEWVDDTVRASVLDLAGLVELAELPDGVFMLSVSDGDELKFRDVYFDLDEAVDEAIEAYRRTGYAAPSPSPREGRSHFRERELAANRKTRRGERPREEHRRNSATKVDQAVLAAVRRAPEQNASGRRLIVDVWDDTSLPLEELAASLRRLQEEGKVILMRGDAVHMTGGSKEEREERARARKGEILVGGNPRHYVLLDEGGRRPNPRARAPRRTAAAPAPPARPVKEVVLEAIQQAPADSLGQRWIADVVDRSGLAPAQVADALIELQNVDRKVALSGDDAVHMVGSSKERERRIGAAVYISGHPRHLVRLRNGARSGPTVARDVEKSFGPSGYPPHRVIVRAGLRVVPITEGRTRGKFWLDEFPDEEFKPGSTIRHDAVHYGVVLEPDEVTR